MSDREHETMQERLPELRAGRLSAADAAVVRAHVATCTACAEELAVLERSAALFAQATPSVDVGRIVGALPAPPVARPALRVERGGARRAMMPRYAMAAAASLVLVASLSWSALNGRTFAPAPVGDAAPDTAGEVSPALPAPSAAAGAQEASALVGAADLEDLGVQQLETLLQELDRLEPTVAAEPVTLQRPVVGASEGL